MIKTMTSIAVACLIIIGCAAQEEYKLAVPEKQLTNGTSQIALYVKKGDSNYYLKTMSGVYTRTQWPVEKK